MHAMRIFSIVTFIIISFLDVRVRAVVFEKPKNCLQAKNDCAINANGRIEILKIAEGTVRISNDSTLIRKEDGELQLLEGTFLIEADTQKIKLHTLYGDFNIQTGKALFEVKSSLVKFVNISSHLEYRPRGEAKDYELPVGYGTYFSGISKYGVADTGFPHPAELEPLVRGWGRVYLSKEKDILSREIGEFVTNWRAATAMVGDWYVGVVKREMASEKAEEERLARLKAQKIAEDEKYKVLFRERIFNSN